MELLPILLIFAVMMLPLLLLSNRQRKMQQKQMELVKQLGVGDEVRTHSGFYGLIVEEYEDIVVLESEDGSQTKWARQAIAMAVEPTTGPVVDGELSELEDAPQDGELADDSFDSRTVDAEQDRFAQDRAEQDRFEQNRGTVPGVTVADDDPRGDEQPRER